MKHYLLFLIWVFFIGICCSQDVGKAQNIEEKTTTTKVIKTDAEWKALLTPEQYYITRQKGTERPFTGEYNHFEGDGIYYCVCCGNPLFDSNTKFDSGTGWPSFTKPISNQSIVEKVDQKFFMRRTEVKSGLADSHLGHVFKDGPAPTELRYYINSASLRFIPKEKLAEQGYSDLLKLFE